MSSESSKELLPNASEGDPGIDLLAIFVAVALEWRIILGTTLVALLISLSWVHSIKSLFVSSATILPTNAQRQDSGLGIVFGGRSPGALYIGLLSSRGVLDDVIDQVGLMQALHIKDRQVARGMLSGETSFAENPNSLLTISVKDPDAQRSAQLANAYLDALRNLNERLSLGKSAETREFFERQLQQERDLLTSAETKLTAMQKSTGLIDPSAQVSMGIGAIQGVRTQITNLQVQLAGLEQRETENAPEVQVLRSQIARLEQQERQFESTSTVPMGAAPTVGDLPDKNLELQRAEREVKQHEMIVESVATQFESARLAEAQRSSSFQVIDRAIVPEQKAWPPRRQLIMLAAVLSFLLGLIASVVKLAIKRLLSDPVSKAHLHRLRTDLFKTT